MTLYCLTDRSIGTPERPDDEYPIEVIGPFDSALEANAYRDRALPAKLSDDFTRWVVTQMRYPLSRGLNDSLDNP